MQLNDEFYTKFQVVVVHLVFLSLDKGYKPPTPPFGNRFALEPERTFDTQLKASTTA
ncbi:hypothetical protein [Rhizobium sp. NFACC06-2]|jgi:hypothetical protein|uniref:hypothetical protein n=1 Tax=Rhizobium sp. NFACC06-2 TaxID=1566264 RepID=UPI00087651B0|nr:hypothetical protein [Rhizobium sp. NFACC06-2]SCY63634.1 hypothetical protein SAMN03159288_03375 [Rhizobium sp. NFACC06-2]